MWQDGWTSCGELSASFPLRNPLSDVSDGRGHGLPPLKWKFIQSLSPPFEHIRYIRARASISSAVGSSCHFLSNSLSNSWPYPLPSDCQLKLDRGQESADVTGLANAPNGRTRWVETVTVIEHELEITPKLLGFHILIVCELVLNRH